MQRVLLTSYLVLFFAAGPSLCCCTTLCWLNGAAESEVAACLTSSDNCCGCSASGCTEPADRCCGKVPGKKAPVRVPCPCKDQAHGCCFLTTPYALPDGPALARWVAEFAYDLPALDLDLTPGGPALAAAAGLPWIVEPFWSTADLLHVQHRLRC